jgi:radical SAM-linked protein
MQLIIHFKKKGMMRFLSAIETSNSILRILKRTGLDMEYSQGFHPAPKVSFLDSTPTGVIDLALYAAVNVKNSEFDLKRLLEELKSKTVLGIEPCNVFIDERNLNTLVNGYEYLVFFNRKPDFSNPLKKHSGKEFIPSNLINIVDEFSKNRYYVVKYIVDKSNVFNPYLFDDAYIAIRRRALVDNKEVDALLQKVVC